jgi:predicted nucleotidyltransferase
LRVPASTTETFREYWQRRERERFDEREALRRERLAAVRATIRRLAPGHPSLRRAALFGSILRPGRFAPESDIDVAVECGDLEEESRFWRALEEALEWNVDVRPYEGSIIRAVETSGEWVYKRDVDDRDE